MNPHLCPRCKGRGEGKAPRYRTCRSCRGTGLKEAVGSYSIVSPVAGRWKIRIRCRCGREFVFHQQRVLETADDAGCMACKPQKAPRIQPGSPSMPSAKARLAAGLTQRKLSLMVCDNTCFASILEKANWKQLSLANPDTIWERSLRIAEILDVPLTDVVDVQKLLDLEFPEPEIGPSVDMDLLASPDPPPDEALDSADQVWALADCLDQRSVKIVKLRLDGHTLEEVGNTFGINRERVRQIEMKAYRDMRRRHTTLRSEAMCRRIFSGGAA